MRPDIDSLFVGFAPPAIGENHMPMQLPLYPLRFTPIYQYRLWGGRRLANWLQAPLPGAEPIGEAWILSDRDDHPSRVAEGALKGYTIAQLMAQWPRSAARRMRIALPTISAAPEIS